MKHDIFLRICQHTVHVGLMEYQLNDFFLTFFDMKNHTDEGMAELILNFFKELEIDFSKGMGQSYDNAANVARKYNGIQQKILKENKFAKLIPCAGHP